MPAKSNKTKWKPFNFRDLAEADQEHSVDSTPSRILSNPISNSQHPLFGSDRRTVSDSRPRVPYLDKPLRAAELQKLHESREREQKAAQLADSGSSGDTSTPLFSASLTNQESVLRTSTNCPPNSAKPISPYQSDDAAAVPKPDFHVRLNSAGPLSNEDTAAETKCLSSSPDRDPGAAVKGATPVGDDMASATRVSGRPNRFENRPPMSTILCRNGPQCRKLQEGTGLHGYRC